MIVTTFILSLFIAHQAPAPIDLDNVPPSMVKVLPACEYEDGNTDGLPCIWDGRYYNDSSAYRN
ncbi:hypothetical protein SEA_BRUTONGASTER_162 [Gordonia phage BrutonGaster]|uniref:Uncharacterized protein n=1 Tax=Gordonia phage BrutonGaster TaxID=2530116 RepID=A0A482JKY2_9CAUD|nr:hypothetical protein HOV26_gp020 [Gordonia phage BrutonGaster]QBP33376.1 hypothetical protein SEA_BRUTONGASTER_162 [Gordonia phage BrutonGaster]